MKPKTNQQILDKTNNKTKQNKTKIKGKRKKKKDNWKYNNY